MLLNNEIDRKKGAIDQSKLNVVMTTHKHRNETMCCLLFSVEVVIVTPNVVLNTIE